MKFTTVCMSWPDGRGNKQRSFKKIMFDFWLFGFLILVSWHSSLLNQPAAESDPGW